MPRSKADIPRSVRIQIAGIAVSDPRTVDRYLFTDAPMTAVAENAIRRALQTLNYPDPRPLAMAGAK
jgi:hypothetical protein